MVSENAEFIDFLRHEKSFCFKCGKFVPKFNSPCKNCDSAVMRTSISTLNTNDSHQTDVPPRSVDVDLFFQQVCYKSLATRIVKAQVKTINHIPRKLRRNVRSLWMGLLKDAAQVNSSVETCCRLIAFPKFVLAACGKKRSKDKFGQFKFTKERLEQFAHASLESLVDGIEEAVSDKQLAVYVSSGVRDIWCAEDANIKACKRLLSLGRFSDAVKALESDGVHFMNNEVRNQLIEKHPHGIPPKSGEHCNSFVSTKMVFWQRLNHSQKVLRVGTYWGASRSFYGFVIGTCK